MSRVVLVLTAVVVAGAAATLIRPSADAAGPGTGQIVYRDETNDPQTRWWNGSSWTSPSGSADVGEYRIVVGAASETRNEMIVVGVNVAADIRGMMWDGSSWTEFPFGTVQSSVDETYWWGMDVAYESQSGDAVMVWNNGTTGSTPISYRVWDGSAWSAEQTISTPVTGEAQQMRLAASPDSDEMVLVVSNDASLEYALVWDGSAWGNGVTLSSTSGGDDRTDVFAAYEQQSGDALVVYGRGSSSLLYRTWNGSSWSSEGSLGVPAPAAGNVRWTTLGADPSSNRIAVGVTTFSEDAWLAVWDGSSWGSQTVATQDTHETAPAVGVGFESTTGDAIAVYSEGDGDDDDGFLRFRTWSAGSGWSGEGTVFSVGEEQLVNSTMLAPSPISDEMIVLAQDSGRDLYAAEWSGSSWGPRTQLESSTGEVKNQPFEYLWDRHVPNDPPAFDQDLGDRTDGEGDTVAFSAGATDPDGDTPLVYSAAGLPSGISIDTGTGLISGTVDYDAAASSPHAVTVTVQDPGGLTDVDTFTWTVTDTNRAPVVTDPGDQSDAEGDVVSLTVSGSDPDLDGITWSASGLPSGLTIDPGSGVISGTVDAAAGSGSPYTVTVTATDDGSPNLDTDVVFTWTVTDTNRAPVVTDPGDQSDAEGDAVSLAVVGSDPDSDSITWSASGLPDGLSIDSGSGVISGTVAFTAGSGAPHSATVTATDDGSPNMATDVVFTWTVTDTNRAPVVTDPGDQSDTEGDTIALTVSGSDPDLDTLTWSATGLPGGLSIDPGSGEISGTIDQSAGSGSPHTVTVTATDDGVPVLDTDAVFTWTVTVVDLSPTFSQDYLGLSSYENETVSVAAAATDPDGDTLTWSATGLPTGLGIDPVSGVITGTVATDAADDSPFAVELRVTDPGGLFDTDTFSWEVLDGDAVFTGSGVEDTEIRSGDADTSFGSNTSISVDLDQVNPAPVGESQGLIRFADIVGTGSGQIPSGSTINSATLYLRVFDPGSGQVQLHRMLVPWTEASTWNSLTGGVQTDDVEATSSADAIVTQPWILGRVPITGLASAVQAWVDGDANEGWALIATSPDGWDFYASEHGTVSYRPELVVDFTPNAPPAFDEDITDRSDDEADVISLSAEATDPEGHGVTYAATGLPTGLSIHPGTGLISGTIDYGAAAGSPYSVSVTATDSHGAQSFDLFTWTVSNVNRAPVVTDPGDQSSSEGDVVSLTAVGSDPDLDVITWSASGLPSGVSIDPASGLISGTVGFDAAAGSPHAVTVTATDDGTPNAATDVAFTWTVSNLNRAPVVVGPSDQSGAEGDPVSLTVAGSDPDSDTITWSATGLPTGLSIDAGSGEISGTIGYEASASSPFSVTVTATDDGSPNLATDVVFAWTVADTNRPPVVTNPGDQSDAEAAVVSLSVVGSDPDSDSIAWSASGLPGGLSIDPVSGVISGTVDFDAAGGSPHSVTVTATDDGTPAFATPVTFTWTVANTNRAPVVTSPADQSDAEGDAVSLAVAGSDPDLDGITWSASGLPSGLTIDPVSGVISGTVGFDAAAGSPHAVTVTATDDGSPNLATDVVFAWTVADTNRPPVVTNPGDQSDAEAAVVSLSVVGSDPDSDSIAWSASGLPGGLSIDPVSGVISGTVDFDAAGGSPHSVIVTASDDGVPIERTDVLVTWVVTDTNRPPLLTSPGDQESAEGAVIDVAIGVSDPDGDDTSLAAAGLPPGLSVTDGRVVGTLGFEAAGTYTVTFTASDDGDPQLATESTVSWVVDDTNRAPVVAAPADRTDAEGDAMSIPIDTSDPDGDTLEIAVTGLPSGVAYDPTVGAVVGTLAYDLGASYDVVVTAVDDGIPELTSQVSFTWSIGETNRAPVVTTPSDRTDQVADPVAFGVVASDPDGDVITTTVEGLPAGVNFSGTTVGGAPIEAGVYTVTLTAVDDGEPAESTTASFLWIVEAPPGFPVVEPIDNQTNTVGDEVLLVAVGSHPNGLDISWTASGLPPGVEIDAGSGVISGAPTTPGTSVVQVIVTDELGQRNLVGFTWFVLPVIDLVPTVVDDMVRVPTDQIPGGGFPVDAAGNDFDPEGEPLSVITAGPVEIGQVSIVDGLVLYLPEPGWIGTVSFPYSVADPAGNTAAGTITIVIEDPLAELIATDVLVVGEGGPGGVRIGPTALTPSTGTELVLGTVFQSLYVLRLPLALLGGAVFWSLLLGGILNLGFVLHRGIPRVVRRTSKNVAIVLVEHGGKVEARSGPGTGDVVARLLATDRAIEATGRRADVGADEWVEIKTEDGKAWIPAHHVTEDVDKASFADDSAPIELVRTFAERLRARQPFGELVASQGLFVAHHAPLIGFEPGQVDALLDDRTVYTWKGRNPAYPDFEGTFDHAVATSVLDAYDHPEMELRADWLVVPSTVIPVEFSNHHFVSIGADVHGRERLDQSAWLVMIAFEGGQPKIAGLCREG